MFTRNSQIADDLSRDPEVHHGVRASGRGWTDCLWSGHAHGQRGQNSPDGRGEHRPRRHRAVAVRTLRHGHADRSDRTSDGATRTSRSSASTSRCSARPSASASSSSCRSPPIRSTCRSSGRRGAPAVLRSVSENIGLPGEDIVPPDDELQAMGGPPGAPPGGPGAPGGPPSGGPPGAPPGPGGSPQAVAPPQGPQTNVVGRTPSAAPGTHLIQHKDQHDGRSIVRVRIGTFHEPGRRAGPQASQGRRAGA